MDEGRGLTQRTAKASTAKQASPAEQNYDFTEQVGHLLRRAYQRHTAIFQKQSSDKQLTSIQFVTLCTVMDRGPSSLVEIVNATAIDPATVRGVISRLNARDLITLSRDPGDQRKVIVEITDAGRALVADMVPRAKHISELTMGRLSQPEQVALTMLLKKMNGNGE